MNTYVMTQYVWDQSGPLAEIVQNFESVYILCTLGSINVIINGTSFPLGLDEVLNEGFQGKTFEITGTGTWNGYLRGLK